MGAAMMRSTGSSDPKTRRALDITTLGFLLLGLSLGGVVFVGPTLSLFSQSIIAAGTLASTVLFASGLALLTGEKPLAPTLTYALLGAAALLATLGPMGDTWLLSRALALGLALTSTLMAFKTRRFLLHPRDGTELTVGWAMALLAASGWLRTVYTWVATEPPPTHLLHLPDWLASPFAVLYGMFPILVATLLLSVVNARLRKQLNTKASTDELTGVLTRRALRELAPAAIAQQRNEQSMTAVLMLDLDHFKHINDHFGHASGDLVLQRSGPILQAQLRAPALLARYGGEEFVVLVPVPELHVARQVAERLREAVATTRWLAVDGRTMTVTLSVGVALMGEHEDLDTALQRADEALYRAKNDGRNQVQVALVAA